MEKSKKYVTLSYEKVYDVLMSIAKTQPKDGKRIVLYTGKLGAIEAEIEFNLTLNSNLIEAEVRKVIEAKEWKDGTYRISASGIEYLP